MQNYGKLALTSLALYMGGINMNTFYPRKPQKRQPLSYLALVLFVLRGASLRIRVEGLKKSEIE